MITAAPMVVGAEEKTFVAIVAVFFWNLTMVVARGLQGWWWIRSRGG